ncbi:LysE family translocator [Vibrio sp. YMD68]|uniref:LysE family translocator n=1 Tax=Vibrio sp. YMD68 TaxID=3042300 RepID=UPI002499ED89|nr:LysE family translocator [Vibrio sp. YMD68]WGV97974.1 LysE family translocator [Vibrio sp. YMD68]
MSFEHVLVFALTVFVVSIIPGPSMILALTHGMYYGTRKSLASALGSVTVTFIQSVISVVGLGAILIASDTVFQVIKWGGAAYLLYMGVSLYLSAKSSPLSVTRDNEQHEVSLFKMYRQSALVAAANPKAIVFFTAVFPQFINHEGAFFIQSIVLTMVCSSVAFLCFMIYAIGGQKLISLFSKSAVSKYFQRTVGGIFVGSGVALALSHQ